MPDPAFISLHDIGNVWTTMPELCQWISVIVISVLGGFGLGVWEASRRMSLQQYAELLRWKLEYLHIALKREEAVSNALAQKILTAPEVPAAAPKVETPVTEPQKKTEEPQYFIGDTPCTKEERQQWEKETLEGFYALEKRMKANAAGPQRDSKGKFLPRSK